MEEVKARTKTYTRVESPEGRVRCARHAVSQLFAWDAPSGAPDDWTPSPAQVVTRTAQLYGWVRLTEVEATAAIEGYLARQVAPAAA